MKVCIVSALLGVCASTSLWAEAVESEQNQVMLLDSCSSEGTNRTVAAVGDTHQSSGLARELPGTKESKQNRIRRMYVQTWHSLTPTSSAAESNGQEPNVPDDEAFLTPDIDETIKIIDPTYSHQHEKLHPSLQSFSGASLIEVKHGNINSSMTAPICADHAPKSDMFSDALSACD